MFENMEKLKKHQEIEHKEFFQKFEKNDSENKVMYWINHFEYDYKMFFAVNKLIRARS